MRKGKKGTNHTQVYTIVAISDLIVALSLLATTSALSTRPPPPTAAAAALSRLAMVIFSRSAPALPPPPPLVEVVGRCRGRAACLNFNAQLLGM